MHEERRAWDQFAAAAMSGICSDASYDHSSDSEVIAKRSAEMADALLKQRRLRCQSAT